MAVDDSNHIAAETSTDLGKKCEIRIWQERHKKDGTLQKVEKNSLGDEDFDTDKLYAITATQVLNNQNVFDHTKVQINSPELLKAFREVIGSYPTVPSDFESPFEMESPLRMLYHYWDDLDVYRQQVKDDVTRMHLNLLFEFMRAEIGPDRATCISMIRKKQISFSKLWILYRPGDLQYKDDNGHPWLLRCVKTAYEESTTRGKWLEVHCTYTDYDGSNVGTATHVVRIYQKQFFAAENPANITDLPMFPHKFLERYDDLEMKVSERGAHFLELQDVLVREYDGLAVYLKDPPDEFFHPEMGDWPGVWVPYTETGRVVLDRKTFQEENHLEQVAVNPTVQYESCEDDLSYRMLCPAFVYGFSLTRKEWCRFYVDKIHKVQWNQHAFDTLVLPDSQKLVLRALVSSHAFSTNARNQAQQKGKGLVLLLHGSPGSGKTLTAESAAEITEKALLSATMGDLNKYNRPWYFEYRLSQLLQYATIWKAIVLLDEADVFLEARQDCPGDAAARNALVAIFLRYLEYFAGIMFLTSNRVGVFDDAMKSRIHLAIEYSPPKLEMRRLIWIQRLQAIPASDTTLDPEEDVYELMRDELNGREISNAVSTAQTLARFESKPLQLSHIETVLKVRKDFEESIHRTRKAWIAKSKREGVLGAPNRQNSLIMSPVEDLD